MSVFSLNSYNVTKDPRYEDFFDMLKPTEELEKDEEQRLIKEKGELKKK
jgi:hypothetical protein